MPKKFLTVIGFAVMLASTAFFLRALLPHLAMLNDIVTDQATLIAISVAVAIYVAIFAVMATAWWVLLKSAGVDLAWYRCVAIFNISQMGKYLPGNFMQHIGRVGLARREGLPTAAVILTSVWELVGVVLAGALISLVSLGLSSTSLSDDPLAERVAYVAIGAGLLLVGSAACLGWVRRHFGGPIRNPLPPALFGCCLAYLAVFVLHGLGLHWIAQARGAPSNLLLVVGVFAIAWIAGFLTPGAIGGIGVRESVLVLGLTPFCGSESAVLLAVAMRLVSTIGDGLAFVVGLLIPRGPLS